MSLRAGPSAFGHEFPIEWSGFPRRREVAYDQLEFKLRACNGYGNWALDYGGKDRVIVSAPSLRRTWQSRPGALRGVAGNRDPSHLRGCDRHECANSASSSIGVAFP